MLHTRTLALLTACTLATGLFAPATSQARVNIDIDIAPPAPRVEVIPGPRVGYVWAPGHYVWRRHAHVWVPGVWIRERRGYHWVPDGWVHNGPRWRYVPGHWAR
jgi:hypothetical protein